jgi:hypothetical protein
MMQGYCERNWHSRCISPILTLHQLRDFAFQKGKSNGGAVEMFAGLKRLFALKSYGGNVRFNKLLCW